KTTRYIATVTFPLMVGFSVVAPQFIRVIFGPQWERSIFLAQILALVGLIQSIGTTVGWIYQSQGRTDIMFRWGLFSVAIVGIAFVIGLHGDVEGVTIAYAIAVLLLAYPNFAIPFRLINLRVSHLFKQLIPAVLAALEMGGIVFALRFFLQDSLGVSDLTTLILAVIVGVISYAGLLFILDRTLYGEVFQLLHQLKPSTQEIAWWDNCDSCSKKEKL
ncbi:MAG: polysaccharide biosynthesis C-terminal domain-containing protein, partial [Candidatus Helarchaeota archaeon]|nr:polysaccharide biosynthesis C-terminal domain-containing protein [Candidatus Helarchaeota archaeon]